MAWPENLRDAAGLPAKPAAPVLEIHRQIYSIRRAEMPKSGFSFDLASLSRSPSNKGGRGQRVRCFRRSGQKLPKALAMDSSSRRGATTSHRDPGGRSRRMSAVTAQKGNSEAQKCLLDAQVGAKLEAPVTPKSDLPPARGLILFCLAVSVTAATRKTVERD